MWKNNIIILGLITLFFSVFNFSREETERYYGGLSNTICGNKASGCSFKVSTKYPISPLIPTSVPEHSLINRYRYFYLQFSLPNNQTQKNFYLEAYDVSNFENIISDGDCYLINNTNKEYEIRIYKEFRENSFIRIHFFGLPKNFLMDAKIRYKWSIFSEFLDLVLDQNNSLYSDDLVDLEENIKEENTKNFYQKLWQEKTIHYAELITGKLFGTNISIIPFDTYFFSETVSIPPFTVIVTISSGLEISKESFFNTEENFLSETKVIKGNIGIHKNRLDSFEGKINIDSGIIKIWNLYRKTLDDIILDFGEKTESFSVTIGFNDIFKNVIITIRYFDDIEIETIYSEIQIKIVINNEGLINLIKKQPIYLYPKLIPYEFKILEKPEIKMITEIAEDYSFVFLIFSYILDNWDLSTLINL